MSNRNTLQLKRRSRDARHALAGATGFVLATLAISSNSAGQSATWIGPSNSSWNVPANWSGGVVPDGPTFNARINGTVSFPGTNVHLQSAVTLDSLTMDFFDVVSLSAAGQLSVLNSMHIDGGISLGAPTTGNTVLSLGNGGTFTITTTGGNLGGITGVHDAAVITGSGVLVNTINIGGRGMVGSDQLSIINNKIVSGAAPGLLTVDPANTAIGFTNNGTISSGGSGTIVLSGAGGGAFYNANGTIHAEFNGTTLFNNGVVVHGGTLSTGSNGVLSIRGSSATWDAVSLFGRASVDRGGVLNINSSLGGSGTIDVAASGLEASTLNFNAGAGTMSLDDVQLRLFDGSRVGGSGTVVVNSTIQSAFFGNPGSTNFGNNQLTIINNGTFTAASGGGDLYVDPAQTSLGFVNNGTMRAINGGTLVLIGGGTVATTGGFQNANNTIVAEDGGVVHLSGARINGGTLRTQVSGQIHVNSAVWNDVTLDGNAFAFGSAGTLALEGSFTNRGTLALVGSLSGAASMAGTGGTFTVGGGGTIQLVQGGNPRPSLRGTGTMVSDNYVIGGGSIGNNTLIVINSGTILASGGEILLNAPDNALGITNNGTMGALSGATLTFRGDNGGAFHGTNGKLRADGVVQLFNSAIVSTGDVAGVGTLIVHPTTSLNANHVRLMGAGQLLVHSGGTLTIRGNGTDAGTSRLATVPVVTGSFDLTDNDLVVDYSGATMIPQARALIASARNGGAWNANGITSTAAASDPVHATTLAIAEASDVLGAGGGTFSGQAVDGSTVLVKYTWYGDTDVNGVVNFDDYARTDAGFNNGGTDWFHGDFDYNGIVNFDDYSLIDLAFNAQSGSLRQALAFLDGSDRDASKLTAPSLQKIADHFTQFGEAYATSFLNAVPEPASAGLISLACATVAMSRRRKQNRPSRA